MREKKTYKDFRDYWIHEGSKVLDYCLQNYWGLGIGDVPVDNILMDLPKGLNGYSDTNFAELLKNDGLKADVHPDEFDEGKRKVFITLK